MVIADLTITKSWAIYAHQSTQKQSKQGTLSKTFYLNVKSHIISLTDWNVVRSCFVSIIDSGNGRVNNDLTESWYRIKSRVRFQLFIVFIFRN